MEFGVADRFGGRFAPAGDTRQQTAEGRRATLLDRFHDAGYRLVDTPVLCPSATFLDFSGEGIRSHLFLTSDAAGQEMCLRPEYTIPVCLSYLATSAGKQADYAYCGPVFRSGQGGSGQFLQAGIESFGRGDIASADAEILVLALQAAAAAGFSDIDVRLGDAGLLVRLFDVLQVPANWQRRLRRGLDRGLSLQAITTEPLPGGPDHAGVIAALTGTDRHGARALVEDLLSIAGIATVGGRSAAEIADRFLTQVATKASPAFGAEQGALLERFLAVNGHPDDAALQLRALADEAKLDLGKALDLFEERSNFLAVYDLDVERFVFDASFTRNLDYYTGFVFEARHADRATPGEPGVVVGGGRYDRLAQSLGAREAIAAVGASIWVERLAGSGRSADA